MSTQETIADRSFRLRKPDRVGIYFLREISLLLRATDHQARADEFSLSPQQIVGWAKKGFANVEIEEVFSRRCFVHFPDLITLRMVAILRSHGISLFKMTIAHDFLADALSTTHPFVDRRLWVDDAEVSEDIYAEIDNILVTASRHGQMPFTQLLSRKIVEAANLTFGDDDHAATWSPHDGVVIDPYVHSGSPCVEGTRIATSSLYGLYECGETADEIADWYELRVDQVESAIGWEERLAA